MVIKSGGARKGEVQSGRNFVHSSKKSAEHARAVEATKRVAFAAKRTRALNRAERLRREILLEFIEERGKGGKKFDRAVFRAKTGRKINSFLLNELSLKQSTKETLKMAFDYDAKLYHTHTKLANEAHLPAKELKVLLKLGLDEMSLLSAKTKAEVPHFEDSKRAILQTLQLVRKAKNERLLISPSAIDFIKWVNDRLIQQLIGDEYEYYREIQRVATANLMI